MATCKDYSRSVIVASDELKEIYCEPCKDGGKHIEAEGFCVECAEYLCRECYKIHTRFKAFKHHALQDKNKMPLDPRKSRAHDVCVERCDKHPTKIVEYFCRSCDKLGCSACITVSHRKCENVGHIPDIAKNFSTSEEFKDFLSTLDQKLEKINEEKKNIQLNTNLSDDMKERGKAELRKQRNKINTVFDKLEADMERRIEDIDKSNKETLQAATHTANSIYESLTQIEKNVKANKDKMQNMNLFTTTRRSKQSLEILDKQFGKLRKEERIRKYSITPSSQVDTVLESANEICILRETARFSDFRSLLFKYK